ncbi:MAG: hypothetical protein JXM69_18445 [Anaerolineae bacterium]|nr:hypothetical protein [Anaerolineae bacterium]
MKTAIKIVILLAVLLLVTAIPVWAGQGMVGSSPYAADLLVSGLNTGTLNPGQEYWYAYSRADLGDPAYNSVVLSLNFEAEGRAVASRVNFQVFNFVQVEAWLKDNSGPIDSLGLGMPASADFDVNTGERFWAGPVAPTDVYYVRVFNISPSPVQYRLTALGQKSPGLEAIAAPASTSGQPVIPAAISVSGGVSPIEFTAPDLGGQASIIDTLPIQPDGAPVSTNWLLAAQAIHGLPPQEAALWLMSAAALGWLPLGDVSSALVPINPDASVTTTAGQTEGANGAEVITTTSPDPTQGYSIYPNQPIKLLQGPNTGRMAPGAEHWYTFTPGKLDGKLLEDMSLTIFFTPGEPNIASLVTFEMFTGSQYQIWERGTPDDMAHFGVGSWVSRDGDYNTGERLWRGAVLDGDQYFVKLTNGSQEWIDYHLIPDDIINIEMGPPLVNANPFPPYIELTPTGNDIGSPLIIGLGHTRAKLAAGEDIWYQFENKIADPDRFEFRSYLIELNHTPGMGHISNHVNVEIYPYQEQQLWRRGDTDQIVPLGAGSDLRYNKVTDTHTWVWDGHLVSNTIYFIRVRNDSVLDIDYDLLIKQK